MQGITVPIIVHHNDLEAWLVALAKLVLHLVDRARVPLVVVLVVHAQSMAHGRRLVLVGRHFFLEKLFAFSRHARRRQSRAGNRPTARARAARARGENYKWRNQTKASVS